MRLVLATFASTLTLLVAARAPAELLSLQTSTMCEQVSTDVSRWTPALGPVVEYVADVFVSRGNAWIGLGSDATGYWSAETSSVDACDDLSCNELELVHTGNDGKRRTWRVARHDEPSLKAVVKKRLFSLAAKEWPVATLTHDETMQVAKHAADGSMAKAPTWWVEIVRTKGAMRFGIRAEVEGCWCTYRWRAWVLAKG